MSRKLASIQRILNLSPIEGAEFIEKATVLGWHCVVKKGDFQAGDLVVYFEIDSILPPKPEFEFFNGKYSKVKTIKLRGQVSQGLVMPVSQVPDLVGMELEEGMDLTDLIGVVKFEPVVPAELAGVARGPFPHFLPKTDETRVQTLQGLLTKYKGTMCYVAEKIDGSSATYYYRMGEFGSCSRNLDLLETETNTFWTVARALDLEGKMKGLGKNICFQGELYGSSIQKNKYQVRGQALVFFNVFDIDAYRFYDFEEFERLMKELGLPMVPIVDRAFVLVDDIDALVEMSKGQSGLNKQIHREGIVIRPLKEKNDAELGRVSFKAINPNFLLKYEE